MKKDPGLKKEKRSDARDGFYRVVVGHVPVLVSAPRDIGAASAQIVDAQEELCRDFAFPVLAWQAKYESIYLLGTSIARPLISKVCVQLAQEMSADTFAHGATGKGNDQCRFQLAAEALDPDIRVLAPWRMEAFRERFPGRSDMIAYCQEKGIPVKASVEKVGTDVAP